MEGKHSLRKKSPVHFADNMGVKNFVKIALSHTVIEINVLWRFMQKFKMSAKNDGKKFFGENYQYTLQTPYE